MSKKDFASALKKTATTQKQVIDDRFSKADSVLLKMEQRPAKEQAVPDPVVTLGSPKVDVVIRDTFSMPPSDHALIEKIRVISAKEGRITNKSEVIRAGLQALAALDPTQLVTWLDGLEKVRPGRK